jgi:hypothetical protein
MASDALTASTTGTVISPCFRARGDLKKRRFMSPSLAVGPWADITQHNGVEAPGRRAVR